MKALTRAVHLAAALAATSLLAADWETWNGCRYVASPSNTADSFRISCGRREYTVRLYSIVASAGDLDAYRMRFGLTEALAQAMAQQAAVFTQQQLADQPFTVVTRWQLAGRSDAIYAYVMVGKQDLGRDLVSRGYAYEHGPRAGRPEVSAMSYVASLRDAQDQARRAGQGAWAHAKSHAPTTNLEADTGYRLSTPGDIRHNARCPYYRRKGNIPCAPNAGSPCKVCGG